MHIIIRSWSRYQPSPFWHLDYRMAGNFTQTSQKTTITTLFMDRFRELQIENVQNLSYSFHCKNDRKTIATLVLSVQFVGDKSFQKDLKFYQQLMVNVLIKRCPLGFELRRETDYQKCDCLKNLSHVQCDINHKTIHRMKHGLWIGYMQ